MRARPLALFLAFLASPLPRSSNTEPLAHPMSIVLRAVRFEAGPWALLLVLALLTPFTRTLVAIAFILFALDLYAYFTVFVLPHSQSSRSSTCTSRLRIRSGGRRCTRRIPRRARERDECLSCAPPSSPGCRKAWARPSRTRCSSVAIASSASVAPAATGCKAQITD
jgi:hypothetical protein